MIAVDDVQWADRLSRYALRSLISRLAGRPIVWVLASRRDDAGVSASAADTVGVEHIRLNPLPRSVIAEIARDRLGNSVTGRVASYLTPPAVIRSGPSKSSTAQRGVSRQATTKKFRPSFAPPYIAGWPACRAAGEKSSTPSPRPGALYQSANCPACVTRRRGPDTTTRSPRRSRRGCCCQPASNSASVTTSSGRPSMKRIVPRETARPSHAIGATPRGIRGRSSVGCRPRARGRRRR